MFLLLILFFEVSKKVLDLYLTQFNINSLPYYNLVLSVLML